MTREELILDCRYYNGEEYPPEGIDSLMWGYEEAWVRMVLDNSPIPQNCLDFYTKRYDLPSILPYEEDGTPKEVFSDIDLIRSKMGSGFTFGQFVNSFGSTITYLFYKYVLGKKVKYEEIKQGCLGFFVGYIVIAIVILIMVYCCS